jgi:hypothetical protein
MSSTHSEVAPHRRVRHQARDALVLMAFSAGISSAFAAAILLVSFLGR